MSTARATCPRCGETVDVVCVVQAAELVRDSNRLLVSFRTEEVDHQCVDPTRDAQPAIQCQRCTSPHPHHHKPDGSYIADVSYWAAGINAELDARTDLTDGI